MLANTCWKSKLVTKLNPAAITSSIRAFGQQTRQQPEPQPYIPSEGSASDVDAEDVLRAKIDPMSG